MKPGIKTTEFWLVVASDALIGAGAIPVPHAWKGAVIAATVLGYALSRGLAKIGVSADGGSLDVPELPPDPAEAPPPLEPAPPAEPVPVPPRTTSPAPPVPPQFGPPSPPAG